MFSTQNIYSQSYTIKTILTSQTELVPDTGLTVTAPGINRQNLYINDKDDVLVNAFLSDGSNGIILYTDGKIKLIAKSVSSPRQPLNESVFIGSVGTPAMNDNGEIVFCGNLSGRKGVYKYDGDGDNYTPLVLVGDSVLGLESTIADFNCSAGKLSLNNNGELAFNADLSDGRFGLFMLKAGAIEPIALEGDILPFSIFGVNNSVIFGALRPVINDKGEIAFRAVSLDLKKPRRTLGEGILLFRNGEIIPIYLPGQEAPGTNGKVFWRSQAASFDLSNDSEVLFLTYYLKPRNQFRLVNAGIGTNTGLFLWTDNEIKPLMLTNDPVPFINDIFHENLTTVSENAINDSGEIASAFNTYKLVSGIMVFSDDKISPVILSKFKPLDDTTTPFKVKFFNSASINNNGNIAFHGSGGIDNIIFEWIFIALKEKVPFEEKLRVTD